MPIIDGQSLPPVASETVVVHDHELGIDRRVVAGQRVPPDLVAAYRTKVGDDATAEDPPEVPTVAYDDQTPEQLAALATQRGLDVKGSGRDGKPLKADLVRAHEAHDRGDV